jgi:hypothetical protein
LKFSSIKNSGLGVFSGLRAWYKGKKTIPP